MRAALLILLTLTIAACEYAQPSPVRTDCVTRGRNPIPQCPDGRAP